MALGYLVHRLDTAEEESRYLKENEDRLRVELDAEQQQHALTREALSTRVADTVQGLEVTKMTQAQLTTQNKSLFAAKERLEETHCVLQAKVARLTDTLADFIARISAPAESQVIEVETGVLGPSTPTSSEGFVGAAASPAEGSSSISAATAANGKEASSISTTTPSSPRAEVAPMSEPSAEVFPVDKVVASPPAVSDAVEAVVAGVIDQNTSTRISSVCSVGPAVSPAEGPSSPPAATAAKGKPAPSLVAATPFRPRVEVARISEEFETTLPVDSFSPTKSAIIVEAATSDAVDLGASTATPPRGSAGPAVSPTKGPSSCSSTTAFMGKVASSSTAVMPCHPSPRSSCSSTTAFMGEVASSSTAVMPCHPSPRFSTSVLVGKMSSPPPKSSRSTQLTPAKAKARNPADGGNDLGECPFLQFNSPPVRKDLNKDREPPRRYTLRPLTPVNANSGRGKCAAGAERPSFAVRAATKHYVKRSSTGGEVPSLASRGVPKKPALQPYLKRGSTAKEVPPLSLRVEAKPAPKAYLKRGSTKKVPSLASGRVAGIAQENGPVGKGPAVEVEVSRGGGARTGGRMKGKGPGDGRKVEVASSGKVLRSASRAAAMAAAGMEAGISAASGIVPAAAAAAAPVQLTRSARSATRRLAQRTNTAGRDVSTRGKFMSF